MSEVLELLGDTIPLWLLIILTILLSLIEISPIKLNTYSTTEPTINPPKNSKCLFFLKYLLSITYINTAPTPYIPQNGPYKKLCLLSNTL